MVYLTTFVRPALAGLSTIGVRYIMGFFDGYRTFLVRKTAGETECAPSKLRIRIDRLRRKRSGTFP